jgi:hypothetical protein
VPYLLRYSRSWHCARVHGTRAGAVRAALQSILALRARVRHPRRCRTCCATVEAGTPRACTGAPAPFGDVRRAGGRRPPGPNLSCRGGRAGGEEKKEEGHQQLAGWRTEAQPPLLVAVRLPPTPWASAACFFAVDPSLSAARVSLEEKASSMAWR